MVIVEPPSLAGGVKAKVTWRSAGVALKAVAALGIVIGTAVRVADATPKPTELTARSPMV